MYQKRRKKERKEKCKKNLEKQQKLDNHTKGTTAASNCQWTKQFHHHNASHSRVRIPNTGTISMNSYTESMRLWWITYCTAIQYHGDQQRQWKQASEVGLPTSDFFSEGHINPTVDEASLLEKYAAEYETSSEEECEEVTAEELNDDPISQTDCHNFPRQTEEEIDLEYLKFLEITHKHREELRLKREAENC